MDTNVDNGWIMDTNLMIASASRLDTNVEKDGYKCHDGLLI